MSPKKQFLLFLLAVMPAAALFAQHDSIPRSTIDAAPVLVPRIDTTHTDSLETGVASYYASKFNGRRTSSGEIFRSDSLTAAHKTLPFGTLVRVTNLKNDSVVIVKINDRLPKSSKRVIDLTYHAAKQLNFIRAGITKVTLEQVGTAPIVVPPKKKKAPVKK